MFAKKFRFDNIFFAKLMVTLLGVYVFVIKDYFHLEEYTNQMSQNVTTRFLSYFYPREPDDIVVVNTDQHSVEQWPPSYIDYAKWLEFLIDYSPKAIVVDINFEQRLHAEYKDALVEVLADAHDYEVPIYGIVSENSDPDIAQWLKPIGTRWDDLELGYYPIRDSNNHFMAGVQIYHDFYTEVDQRYQVPMFLKWPSRPLPQGSGFWSKLKAGWDCVLHCADHPDDKPYFDKFKVQDMVVSHQQATEQFTDRIVFFGSERPASKDFFPNPIYGQVPGVFLHALALDNLIKYGDNYVKRDDSLPLFAGQGAGGLIEILLLITNLCLFLRFESTLNEDDFKQPRQVGKVLLKTFLWAVFCFVITVLGVALSHLLLRSDPSNIIGLLATNIFMYETIYYFFVWLFALNIFRLTARSPSNQLKENP